MHRLLLSLFLFLLTYLTIFTAIAVAADLHGPAGIQWTALLAVVIATLVSVRLADAGRWSIGFGGPWRAAILECGAGLVAAGLLIFACDALIRAAGGVATRVGEGVDLRSLATLFLPAAVHEELLFRGYLFQKLHAWRRDVALAVTSLLFAGAHYRNAEVSPLAILNIVLAGVILGYAYLAFRRLWLPIAIHFSWNVVSGPILGYSVSGMGLPRTLFVSRPAGPAWISGGQFGIEASIMMTLCELAAIALVWKFVRTKEMRGAIG